MAGNSITTKLPQMAAGQRYGRLVVVGFVGRNNFSKQQWRLRCDCGNEVVAVSGNVRRGATRSCGCLNAETRRVSGKKNVKHGKSNGPEYTSWKSMIARCGNPKATGFDRYGGRGIKVCKRWQTFATFYADMGPRPAGTSLDRYPNKDGDYEPDNVRWATRKQQGNNQGTNRMIVFRGASMSLADACALADLDYHAVHMRISHYGWSVERALSTPLAPHSRTPRR